MNGFLSDQARPCHPPPGKHATRQLDGVAIPPAYFPVEGHAQKPPHMPLL